MYQMFDDEKQERRNKWEKKSRKKRDFYEREQRYAARDRKQYGRAKFRKNFIQGEDWDE